MGASSEEIPGRYLAIMTLSPDSVDISDEEIARMLDEKLMEVNSDYQDLRSLGEIRAPEVVILSYQAYSRFLEATELGRDHGHNKPRHIFPGEISIRKWKSYAGQCVQNHIKPDITESAEPFGQYICSGYDTFGPFKFVGGLRKGHPDADEIQGAVRFYEGL